jgi:hypothetical protein
MEGEARTQPRLTTRVVYLDLPDMIELETRVEMADWQGVARAYASPNAIRQAANSLQKWCCQPKGVCKVEAGADTGIGWLQLRFYPVDSAGHLVCHINLASGGSTDGRPEELRRLSLEMHTEAGLIDRYARHLEQITESLGAEAVLLGIAG